LSKKKRAPPEPKHQTAPTNNTSNRPPLKGVSKVKFVRLAWGGGKRGKLPDLATRSYLAYLTLSIYNPSIALHNKAHRADRAALTGTPGGIAAGTALAYCRQLLGKL
jgi:hypothetical protein